jgi:hypothetical protein
MPRNSTRTTGQTATRTATHIASCNGSSPDHTSCFHLHLHTPKLDRVPDEQRVSLSPGQPRCEAGAHRVVSDLCATHRNGYRVPPSHPLFSASLTLHPSATREAEPTDQISSLAVHSARRVRQSQARVDIHLLAHDPATKSHASHCENSAAPSRPCAFPSRCTPSRLENSLEPPRHRASSTREPIHLDATDRQRDIGWLGRVSARRW